MPPSPEEQIRFLVNFQRLLDEGSSWRPTSSRCCFACRSVHREWRRFRRGDAGPYCRHCREVHLLLLAAGGAVPVARGGEGATAELWQTGSHRERGARRTGRIRRLAAESDKERDGVATATNEGGAVVREMPLQYLQNVGGERLDFLYGEVGRVIELRPGVVYNFRKFHALITDLVRGAWLRYVRQQNLALLGETADLNEFLFGSERNNLAAVRPVLMDIQRGRCFYCKGGITGATAHVDHFVAWARYPVDLGHNFVLADDRCNNKKRERLPACEHLAAWTERNATYGDQMRDALERRGIVTDLAASNRVTAWAYGQTEAAGGLTWLRGDEMVRLPAEWKSWLGATECRLALKWILVCNWIKNELDRRQNQLWRGPQFFAEHWGDIASVLGFAFTIWFLIQTKSAADAARDAAIQSRSKLLLIDSVSDCAAAISMMEEIKRLHRSATWSIPPDRYSTLRRSLSELT